VPPPVYTKQLAGGNVTASETINTEPPDGFVWIVTDIDVHFTPPGSDPASFEVKVNGWGFAKWICPVNRGRNISWRGRCVVTTAQGLQIAIVCDLSVRFQITGYELALP
jgi:hypothetical protein